MNESKITMTKRLTAEGRWEEASRFRDEARQRLRASGKSKREANALAWEEMAIAFAPDPATVAVGGPCRAGITTVATRGDGQPAAMSLIPPTNHRVCALARADLGIWASEYDIDLPGNASQYVEALLSYYWNAGRRGVLPKVDVFGQ